MQSHNGSEYDFAVMIALVLALGLLLQGSQAQGPSGQSPAAAGVVIGQIQTREGAPATAVRVAAIPAPPPRAREGLNYYVPPAPTRVTQTDDQGRYRLTNLPPGEYLIAAGLTGVGTYYPGETDSLRAAAVTVTADAPATVNIRMVTPIGARVSGRVTPPPTAGSGDIAVLSGVTLAEVAEVPIGADGQFGFGRVPAGRYLVSIFPTPPGFGSLAVDIREADATTLEIKRPPVHAVSGRVVTTSGPIPEWAPRAGHGQELRADHHQRRRNVHRPGPCRAPSLRIRRHAGRLLDDVGAGRIAGCVERSDDRQRRHLRTGGHRECAAKTCRGIRGTIAGLTRPATVEMKGPIVGVLTTAIGKDGSFQFPAATPGLYYLRVPEAPELGTVHVAVTWQGDTDVQLKLPSR